MSASAISSAVPLTSLTIRAAGSRQGQGVGNIGMRVSGRTGEGEYNRKEGENRGGSRDGAEGERKRWTGRAEGTSGRFHGREITLHYASPLAIATRGDLSRTHEA